MFIDLISRVLPPFLKKDITHSQEAFAKYAKTSKKKKKKELIDRSKIAYDVLNCFYGESSFIFVDNFILLQNGFSLNERL